LEVDKQVQPEEPIPAGKDFVPIVEGFVHMAFHCAPTVGYLARRVDFDLEILATIEP